MKANEFIKKYGLDCAKQELIVIQEAQLEANHQDYIDDLKCLIEAHNLVKNLGGLELAKSILENAPKFAKNWMVVSGYQDDQHRLNIRNHVVIEFDEIKKAIADVENRQ